MYYLQEILFQKKNIITPKDLKDKKCATYMPNHSITKQLISIFEKNKSSFNPQYQFQNAGISCLNVVDNPNTNFEVFKLNLFNNQKSIGEMIL